jgi:RNA polymerase sigma factor (TIGR02999 family)
LALASRGLQSLQRISGTKPDKPLEKKSGAGTGPEWPPMSEITTLLHAARDGDRQAADRAYALLYADLHRVAHSRLRREGEFTLLDTTALVHESYLRLRSGPAPDVADRHHFLAYAARVMRSVIVDLVRARQAERRGGGAVHLTLNTTLAGPLPTAVTRCCVCTRHWTA